MPINLPCTCGRTLCVDDEHAGQLTRCPGCQTIHKIPDPEPQFEVVEDDKPIRARVVTSPKPPAYTLQNRDEEEEEEQPRKKKQRGSSFPPRRKKSGFNFALAWRIFAGLFLLLLGIGGIMFNIGDNNWKNIGRASVMMLVGGSILLWGFTRDE